MGEVHLDRASPAPSSWRQDGNLGIMFSLIAERFSGVRAKLVSIIIEKRGPYPIIDSGNPQAARSGSCQRTEQTSHGVGMRSFVPTSHCGQPDWMKWVTGNGASALPYPYNMAH